MEVNLVACRAVRGRLGVGQDAEGGEGDVAGMLGYGSRAHDALDVGQRAVLVVMVVAVVVAMLVVVLVLVLVRMVLLDIVVVVLVVVTVGVFAVEPCHVVVVVVVGLVQHDVEVEGGKTVLGHAGHAQPLEAVERHARHRLANALLAGTQVQQRRHEHVARDARGAVQVQAGVLARQKRPCVGMCHCYSLSVARGATWLMRCAWNPAPNPLSTFTTETPDAQELSMARSAARPP